MKEGASMRELRKLAWAAIIAAAASAPAAAQQGTITSGGGATTGNLGGAGGLTGGGAGQLGGTSGGLGGNSGGSTSGSTGSPLQGTQLQSMTAPPKLMAPTGTASSSLAKSNAFAGYYANPYFQGQITAQTNATPGGFGTPLYGAATGGTGSINRGTGGGIGGARPGQSGNQQSGILIPISVQMSYSAQMRFPTAPVAVSRIQTDLRVVIDGTSEIANPKGVQVVTDDFNNVTLRGTVKDDDEARLVEGLVRLTPGVGFIKNELTATASAGPRK
jgi:hypothetical protein